MQNPYKRELITTTTANGSNRNHNINQQQGGSQGDYNNSEENNSEENNSEKNNSEENNSEENNSEENNNIYYRHYYNYLPEQISKSYMYMTMNKTQIPIDNNNFNNFRKVVILKYIGLRQKYDTIKTHDPNFNNFNKLSDNYLLIIEKLLIFNKLLEMQIFMKHYNINFNYDKYIDNIDNINAGNNTSN